MDRVRFADIVVDVAGMRVTRAGAPVALEPKAFDVLVHLVRERGRLVDKEELVRVVWHGTAITDNAITRVVAQLRRGLGDGAREPRYIETVPTRGYRFIARIEEVEEAEGGTRDEAEAVRRGATRAGRPRSLLDARWLLAAAALFLVAGLGAGWLVSRRASAGERVAAADAGLPFRAGVPTQVTVSTGLDHFPSVSPDGTAVAYASDRPGRFEIVVKALAPGGGDRWVTNDGRQNVQPAWSPDGRYLAYHARVPGGVWIVPALGGAPRQLAETGSAPAWSPDGRWIAYQTAPLTDLGPSAGVALPPSVIALVSPESGEQRRLTQPGAPEGGHGLPVWTPDGARVVFVLGAARHELWTVPAAGGAPQRLVACGSACLDPFFGPDGAVYFTQGHLPRIVRVPVDPATGLASGEPRPIAVPVGGTIRHVSVSANGRIAAFAVLGIRSNLATVGVDARGRSTSAVALLTNDTSRRNTYPAFSPDGRRIAFTSGRAGRGPDIWVIDAGGSEPVPVTVDPGSEGSPQWLPGSREILFKSYRNGQLALSAVDVATRRERLVFAFDPARVPQNVPHAVLEAFTLRVAPDVRSLAFAASVRGVPNVFLGDRRMHAVRQLTRDAEGASFPVIGPAGDRVAVQATRGGNTRLAVVPIAGGPVTPVTSSPGQTWIHSWSPDGRFIAAAVMRDGVWNVAAIDVETGREQPLTRYTEPRMYVRYPDWSPLGDRLAFEHAEVTGNIWISELSAPLSSSTAIW